MKNNFFWISPAHLRNYKQQNSFLILADPIKLSSKEESANFQILKEKCESLETENQQLKQEIDYLKDKKNRKRKILRRSEEKLDKCFQCPFDKCKKEYASQLALNLHMKTKHNAGTKKQRDIYADLILQAEKEGTKMPDFGIQLPPNYIDKYRYQKFKGSKRILEDEDQQRDEDPEEFYQQMNQQS